MKKTLLVFFLSVSCCAAAQEAGFFRNPVIKGDMADPSIIRIENTYYATGTSSEWAPFYPLYKSADLVNWEQAGHVFDKKPEWTSNSFWAPELFVHGGKVFCYYTARRKSDNVSYIGVATAKNPLRGFTDHGPLVEHGSEAIDAFVFDDGGRLYISWKAYGLDRRPIELLACRLSSDGLRLEGEPFSLMIDTLNEGMEGQCHFKRGDYYYIIYSSHGCCGPHSDYDVCAARSKSFEGPYERFPGNPILHGGGTGDYQSCGHGTMVETPDGRMFYMCHAYLRNEGFFGGRQPVIQEMFVNGDGWIEFAGGPLAAARQPLPFPGTVLKPAADFTDEFDKPELKADWTWNYPYSDVETRIKNGKLMLGGTPKEGNNWGSVLCLRPQGTDYWYGTQVANINGSMKGLTMYGDNGNLVFWGVCGGKLIAKKVGGGGESVIWESGYGAGTPHLKIEVERGCMLSFYYSGDGVKWIKPHDGQVDCSDLTRWDRVARPGVIHIGERNSPAEFSYFKSGTL